MGIIQCTPADLVELKAISIETYQDTFAPYNTEENMQAYLEAAYHSEKVAQRTEKSAVCFFFCKEEAIAGYLKA